MDVQVVLKQKMLGSEHFCFSFEILGRLWGARSLFQERFIRSRKVWLPGEKDSPGATTRRITGGSDICV